MMTECAEARWEHWTRREASMIEKRVRYIVLELNHNYKLGSKDLEALQTALHLTRGIATANPITIDRQDALIELLNEGSFD